MLKLLVFVAEECVVSTPNKCSTVRKELLIALVSFSSPSLATNIGGT